MWIDHDRHEHGYEHHSDHQDHPYLDDNKKDEVKMPRDCLIETALAEETRLEAKLLNDTEIELYKVFVLFVEISRSAALKWPRCEPFLFGCLFTKSKQHQMSMQFP